MTIKKYIFALLSLGAASCPLLANFSCTDDIRDKNYDAQQLNVGPILNYAHYEYGCHPALRGALAGIHFDFQHIPLKREYIGLRFDGRWNAGSISDCSQEKNRIQDYRAEFDLGYNHCWCDDDMRLTPFAGVGFFYLANEECNCLKNRYYNVFVPLGLKYEWMINYCFRWGIEAEYRLDAWTRLNVDLECETVCEKTKLHPRTQGLLIELPFVWQGKETCNKIAQLKLVPFFDWNRFGRSCGESSSCSCSCSSSSILCAFDSCEDESCDVPRLNQWYVGVHLDLGIRF